MKKSIFKKRRTENFTHVPNGLLHDANLSWKAKGLLVFLLSLPDNWEVIASHLKTKSTDGVDSVYSGLKELCDARYVWKRPRGGSDAGGWEYILFDEPHHECPFEKKPNRSNPNGEKAQSGNSHTTNNVSKEEQRTKDTKNEKASGELFGELDSPPNKPESEEIPPILDNPAFITAWEEYLAYRAERKIKKLAPRSKKALLKQMAGWGSAAAIEAITNTIANGYQGVFPPKNFSGPARKPETARPPSKYAWEIPKD